MDVQAMSAPYSAMAMGRVVEDRLREYERKISPVYPKVVVEGEVSNWDSRPLTSLYDDDDEVSYTVTHGRDVSYKVLFLFDPRKYGHTEGTLEALFASHKEMFKSGSNFTLPTPLQDVMEDVLYEGIAYEYSYPGDDRDLVVPKEARPIFTFRKPEREVTLIYQREDRVAVQVEYRATVESKILFHGDY